MISTYMNDYPGQTSTVVNGRIWRNTTKYMVPYYAQYISVSFTEKYGDIRRKKTVVYGRSIRSSYTISVLLHISAYMIVFLRIRHGDILSVIRAHVKRQNTILYGRIRKRIQSFTGVYGVRNRRPGYLNFIHIAFCHYIISMMMT